MKRRRMPKSKMPIETALEIAEAADLPDGAWRVATFRYGVNAEHFVAERRDPNLFVSCETASAFDLWLARD